MQILQATSFNNYVKKGGTTRPWIVLLAHEDGTEFPYVVKLFNQKDGIQQFPVFKEAIGSLLAREFDLRTPEFAFADFSDDFVAIALEEEQRDILRKKERGLKFASRLIDSSVIYSPSIHSSYLKEYEFANLYAFDCLIYNIDRGRRIEKPNVFLQDNSFLLFDHELSLAFLDNTEDFWNSIVKDLSNGLLNYNYQQHLCYPHLKNLPSKSKEGLFDEFEDYLRNLNISKVEQDVHYLSKLGIRCNHPDRLLSYLYRFQKQARDFSKLLQKSVL